MSTITRQPERAAEADYDCIVIGGGIQGACVLLAAARRGLRVLLLERDDFGAATSWNSLRILHGGLRYLQSLDLRRFAESVAQRRWFIRHFPDMVQPLECLMPLYGQGMRRPGVLRAALALNDVFSAGRNRGVRADRHLGRGRVIGVEETRRRFPLVDTDGLRGTALWHDALMLNSQRMLIEIIRWSCALGAQALNYMPCEELLTAGGRVAGVRAQDQTDGRTHEYRAPVVINCAGPWCGELAARFDHDITALYRPSLAFNLLLEREPLSAAAVAAGTMHVPWTGPLTEPRPTADLIRRFLGDLNQAVPGLEARAAEIVRVFAGFMPTRPDSNHEPAHRPRFVAHGEHGGPAGLYTYSGIKWTTAQLEGERVMGRIFASRRRLEASSDNPWPVAHARCGRELLSNPTVLLENGEAAAELVGTLAAEESVVHLDDLLLRRTGWGTIPAEAEQVAGRVGVWLGWEAARVQAERVRLAGLLEAATGSTADAARCA